jgi:raffinose/stachyose/melibiose transport system permease protein
MSAFTASLKNPRRPVTWFGVVTITFFAFLAVLIFAPLLIVLFASLKSPLQIAVDFPLAPPLDPTGENWLTVLRSGNILRSLGNSLILVVFSVGINAFLASSVAYCLSRFEFRGKKLVMVFFLVAMLVPGVITEISRFGIIKSLGIYNTLLAPILIYIGADMMQLYVYLQFMNTLPVSLDESAMLDGASYFTIYWRIIFPLTLPAVATLSILKMVEIMNDMFIPYLYMPSPNLKTLTTVLLQFSGAQNGSWNNLSAAIILVMLPTTILYIIFNKAVFRGIAAGAVKE